MIGKSGMWLNVFCCNIYHIHESNIYVERLGRDKL